MGNILTGKVKDPLGKLKSQLSELGDRHPFGDDEILRLGRCFAYLRHTTPGHGELTTKKKKNSHGYGSFLCRWAMYCSTLPSADFENAHLGGTHPYRSILQIDPNLGSEAETEEARTRRCFIGELMGVVEEHVLPIGFGEVLRRAAFEGPGQPSRRRLVSGEDGQDAVEMDQLDRFLGGAADCSRRGSRKALEIMFRSCAADNTNNNNTNHNNNQETRASAADLLNLAYRLASASYLLKTAFSLYDQTATQTKTTQSIDVHQILRKLNAPSFYPQNHDDGIHALVQSLLQHATKQQPLASNAYSTYATATTTTDNQTYTDGTVSLSQFQEWSESSAPCLSACFETFVHYLFFPDKRYPPSRTEFIFPNLKQQHSAFFQDEEDTTTNDASSSSSSFNRTSPLLFTLAAMSPSLGGSWHRLFTSDSDGLSFNRLLNSLLGYSGPTLLILRESSPSSGIFGAFTSTKWKEAANFYGNSDSFLFRILPSVAVYRPRNRGVENYMYCNSEARSRGYDRQPHGIGFGGSIEKPRFFVAETLDGCMASSGDLTFESGPLLPPPEEEGQPPRKYFEVQSVEVWGVGGDAVVEEALGERSKQREIVASNIKKARKVDKAQFLDDFKSGLIESKAFQHREQMRGREDCKIDDEDENNYVYEK